MLSNRINRELREYIEKNIFPNYLKNDRGHRQEHIDYVIRRSLKFMDQFDALDADMVYTAAAYHDIAHYINKDLHEILSAKVFFEDEEVKRYFSLDKRKIIREAIEDHRSTMENPPRSDYGKVLSSADRSTDVDDFLRRTYAYSMKHFPEYTADEHMERCYKHMCNKYGKGGYAKSYVKDEEYLLFCNTIEALAEDRKEFEQRYLSVVHKA